jgi:hypothetical protein
MRILLTLMFLAPLMAEDPAITGSVEVGYRGHDRRRRQPQRLPERGRSRGRSEATGDRIHDPRSPKSASSIVWKRADTTGGTIPTARFT